MLELSHIRVIGFDLDQTLYPKSPLIDEKIQKYLYEQIAAHTGVTRDEAEKLFKDRYQGGAGLSGRQTMLDLGIPNPAETVQEALERADIAAVLAPDEETTRLLADLKSKYRNIDLVTGSNRRQTEKKLAALAIPPGTFSHIITADQSSKSDGASYRAWLALYPHLSSDQFLYVGDRVRSDHEVPSNFGIQTVLVYVKTPDPALACPQFSSLKEGLLELLQ